MQTYGKTAKVQNSKLTKTIKIETACEHESRYLISEVAYIVSSKMKNQHDDSHCPWYDAHKHELPLKSILPLKYFLHLLFFHKWHFCEGNSFFRIEEDVWFLCVSFVASARIYYG